MKTDTHFGEPWHTENLPAFPLFEGETYFIPMTLIKKERKFDGGRGTEFYHFARCNRELVLPDRCMTPDISSERQVVKNTNRYLMTNIFYKNEDEEWHPFSITDGDPTGRIRSFWLPSNILPVMEDIVAYFNSEIVCIYEKKINPRVLKFNLLRCPEEGEPNYGYHNQHKWETTECYFERKTLN